MYVPQLFLLFSIKHFLYHLFYPDVTHMRKDSRPSPTLPYWKQWKAGQGLGTRILHSCFRASWQSQIHNTCGVCCGVCWQPWH